VNGNIWDNILTSPRDIPALEASLLRSPGGPDDLDHYLGNEESLLTEAIAISGVGARNGIRERGNTVVVAATTSVIIGLEMAFGGLIGLRQELLPLG